jgi:IS30 family transposase
MRVHASPCESATIFAQQARHQDASRANLSCLASPTPRDETENVVSSSGFIQHSRMKHGQLVDRLFTRLRNGWTPEKIGGRLPHDFPDDPRMPVRHETLYAWIYGPGRRERQLWQYLPRGHKKRRKRAGRRVHSDRTRWRVSIHGCPWDVESRTTFGH